MCFVQSFGCLGFAGLRTAWNNIFNIWSSFDNYTRWRQLNWCIYGRKNRVAIFLNGQFRIVYTCKPHINHKCSLVRITPRIFSSKMLYFGWWERSWLNIYEWSGCTVFHVSNLYTALSTKCLHSRKIGTSTLNISQPGLFLWSQWEFCISIGKLILKVWNSLPPSVRRLSESTFSKGCKRKLFDALSSSDDYIDLTQIMQTVCDTFM